MKYKIKNIMILTIACSLSFMIGVKMEHYFHPNSIRISQASIQEIALTCAGDYRDLAVNRQFVYANCVRRGPRFGQPGIHEYVEPVTVQNYKMKQ